MNQRRRTLLAASLVATTLPRFAQAADARWPTKPVRIVAGGAGSVTDIRARFLADRLAPMLGQPFLVENKAGAGGNIAAELVARSLPDGHALLLTHQGISAVNPHLYSNLGYDSLRDFAPVTRFGIGPLLLTVAPSLPVVTVSELIELAKAKPGTLTFGSPGIGTPPHLASELFLRSAGIQAIHVPYKSGGAMTTDLMSGQISWTIEGPTAQLPHVRGNRLRALAVTGTERLPALLGVPTLAESGLPGYEYFGWTGIVAPVATPQAVISRLQALITEVGSSEAAREWFTAAGAAPGILTPKAFGDFIRAEHAKFGRLVREAGIRPT